MISFIYCILNLRENTSAFINETHYSSKNPQQFKKQNFTNLKITNIAWTIAREKWLRFD